MCFALIFFMLIRLLTKIKNRRCSAKKKKAKIFNLGKQEKAFKILLFKLENLFSI